MTFVIFLESRINSFTEIKTIYMKSLSAIATNPFQAPLAKASYDNNVKFLDDTIGRCQKLSVDVIYSAVMTLLKSNVIIFKTAAGALQKGDQKSATSAVNTTVAGVEAVGKRLKIKLEDVFEVDTTKLMEFFPNGFSSMYNATRGELTILLGIWAAKGIVYTTELGDTWTTELTALKTAWAASLSTQSAKKQEVSTGISDADNSTIDIAQNLWDLFLLIVKNNQPNAENIVTTYFDTTPLQLKDHSDTDGMGRTTGIVSVAGGDVLQGVDIVITDAANQIVWKSKSKAKGEWRSISLPIGLYHISFAKPGFITQNISKEIMDASDTNTDTAMVVG